MACSKCGAHLFPPPLTPDWRVHPLHPDTIIYQRAYKSDWYGAAVKIDVATRRYIVEIDFNNNVAGGVAYYNYDRMWDACMRAISEQFNQRKWRNVNE
jgi:hypothetical protein